MQPIIVNTINIIPGDLVLRIADDLDNSLQIVCLASTCEDVHKIFTQVQDNAFFKTIGVKSYPLSFTQADLGDTLFAKIFYLKSWNFTCLPAGSITISAFKKTRRVLHEFFPKCSLPVIEASIRFDLRDKCSLVNLANAMETDPNHPKAEKIKQEIPIKFDKLNAKKIVIEGKMSELLGPDGDNGTIEAAWMKSQDASQKSQNAMHAAAIALEVPPDTDYPRRVELVLNPPTNMLSLHPEREEAFRVAQSVFLTKSDEYNGAIGDWLNLRDELYILAQWRGANLTGGKHFKVTTKLANFDPTGKAQIQKVVDFFRELGVEILLDNDDITERSRTLNEIMKR